MKMDVNHPRHLSVEKWYKNPKNTFGMARVRFATVITVKPAGLHHNYIMPETKYNRQKQYYVITDTVLHNLPALVMKENWLAAKYVMLSVPKGGLLGMGK